METKSAGIYLIVDFEWAEPFNPEHGKLARKLHDTLAKGHSWIKEAVAASNGIGQGTTHIWVFWLENYAALDRLLRDSDDEIGKIYRAFFSAMPVVQTRVKEGVQY
jgi:hypothetical protein